LVRQKSEHRIIRMCQKRKKERSELKP
jgi:hypothetical protein